MGKNLELMLAGKLHVNDEEIQEILAQTRVKVHKLNEIPADNLTTEEYSKAVETALKDILGHVGESICVRLPFYVNYGRSTSIGDNVFINSYCIILDDAPIEIGSGTMIGPRVSIFTAYHPYDAEMRAKHYNIASSIKIGKDCWIGGGAIINPGVTIGDRTIIGSGSVVTHDIPSDVIAVGNPCYVMRRITDADKKYWTVL